MINIYSANGEIVRTSKNLRGMREYAAVSPVKTVVTIRNSDNKVRGALSVGYENGAFCVTSFASFHIMIDFVRNRRSWKKAKITHHDGDMGYLTKPGIIAGLKK